MTAPQQRPSASAAAAVARIEGHEQLCTERWEQARATSKALVETIERNRADAIAERTLQHAENKAALDGIYTLIWRFNFAGLGVAISIIGSLIGLLFHAKGP